MKFMTKIPYFPFYTDDWIASQKRHSFSYAEQGIYVLLLAHSWNFPDGCIPANKKIILKLCPDAGWKSIKKVLHNCFIIDDKGYHNAKIKVLKDRAKDRHKAAINNANLRWNKKKADATAYAKVLPESIANQNQNQNQIKEESKESKDMSESPKNGDLTIGEPKTLKPPRKKKASNPKVKIVMDYACQAFQEKFGVPPVVNYGAVGKLIKKLLETDKFTADALLEEVNWYLTTEKAQEHPTLSVCFNADTMQRWQISCPE